MSYTISSLVLILAALLPFQNCQQSRVSSSPESTTAPRNNGYVYEGKVYVYLPDEICSDGKKGRAAIRIASSSTAQKIRANCLDLQTPVELSSSEFSISPTDPQQLLHEGVVFVAESKIARIQMAERTFITGSVSSITSNPFANQLSAGNLLACAVVYYTGGVQSYITSVQDSSGNSLVRAGQVNTGTGMLAGYTTEVWYKENLASAPAGTTVTATTMGLGMNVISCYEYSGVAQSNALGQTLNNRGSGTGTYSVSAGSANPDSTNELAFLSVISSSAAPSTAVGFNTAFTSVGNSFLEKIVQPGPLALQLTVTDAWTVNLVTFRAAP